MYENGNKKHFREDTVHVYYGIASVIFKYMTRQRHYFMMNCQFFIAIWKLKYDEAEMFFK